MDDLVKELMTNNHCAFKSSNSILPSYRNPRNVTDNNKIILELSRFCWMTLGAHGAIKYPLNLSQTRVTFQKYKTFAQTQARTHAGKIALEITKLKA